MKNYNWAKTILLAHKYLERISEGIDKLVEREAMNSYFYSSIRENGITRVADKILKLTERKKRLINIKVLNEKCLSEVLPLYAKILIGRYINEESCEELAKRLNLPERTFFRRLMQAEEGFVKALCRNGFDDEKLTDYLHEEKWIYDIYQNLSREEKIAS